MLTVSFTMNPKFADLFLILYWTVILLFYPLFNIVFSKDISWVSVSDNLTPNMMLFTISSCCSVAFISTWNLLHAFTCLLTIYPQYFGDTLFSQLNFQHFDSASNKGAFHNDAHEVKSCFLWSPSSLSALIIWCWHCLCSRPHSLLHDTRL